MAISKTKNLNYDYFIHIHLIDLGTRIVNGNFSSVTMINFIRVLFNRNASIVNIAL